VENRHSTTKLLEKVHEVGLEPTNRGGAALEAAGFDRFPIRARVVLGIEPRGMNPVHNDLP